MPGIKELEYLREELSQLGDERAVTAARGETYEELPRPSSVAAAASKLDVDGLLASLGPEPAAKGKAPSSPRPGSSSRDISAPRDISGFDELLASLPLDTPKTEAPAKAAAPAQPKPAPVKPAPVPVQPKPAPESRVFSAVSPRTRLRTRRWKLFPA